MATTKVCAQCAAPNATKRCSRCKACYYCSVDCQKTAWKVSAWVLGYPPIEIVLQDHKKSACFVAAQPLPPPPPRTGGSWDDVSEQQLQMTLSSTEIERAASSDPTQPTLLEAVAHGVVRGELKAFANPPQYDRIVLQTLHAAGAMPGTATYIVEAGLDIHEGTGWWTTKDWLQNDLQEQGLVQIDAGVLQAEYAAVFAFLELCKRVDQAPRYMMKTDLDPDCTMPHVLAMVEKIIGSSSLRFLLDRQALTRLLSE